MPQAVPEESVEHSTASAPESNEAQSATVEGQAEVASTASEGLLPIPSGGSVIFTANGTQDLDYVTLISTSDLPANERTCGMPPVNVLVTDPEGNSSWVDFAPLLYENDALGNPTSELRIRNIGLRYPGGKLTLTYFSKAANSPDTHPAFACASMSDPTDPNDTSGLIAYKTTTLDVQWQKPEITKARSTFDDDGDPQILVEADSNWTDFEDEVTAFRIEDYGTDQQTIDSIANVCDPYREVPADPERTGPACYLRGSYPEAGDAIGFAALPDNVDTVTVTEWPPAEALSTRLVHSVKTLGLHVPSTKAGAPDSAQCLAMCTGDPVDTYSGNFFDKNQDLVIPGAIGLSIERRYAIGLLGDTGAFGNGTALNYDMRLKLDQNSNAVTVIEPSGNESPFVAAENKYIPRVVGTRAELRETADGWSFKRWDETVTYHFDAEGLLSHIVDPNRNQVTIQRTDGHVSKVSEGDRWIEFTWSDDLLTAAVDHAGRTVSYQYDTNDQLIARTDPAGQQKQYEYDAEGRVTKMIFEDGTTTINTYDGEDRIVEQVLPSGKTLQLSYGQPSNSGIVKNVETAGDVTKTYTYDKQGRITEFVDSSDPLAHIERRYTSQNQIDEESIFEGGRPKAYEYTYSNGDLVKIYESRAKATETFEYDAEHRAVVHVDPAGIRTENSYDEDGNLVLTKVIPTDESAPRITSYTLDSEGRATSIENPLGGISTLTYDTADQLTSVTDPNGAVTTNAYDNLGRLVQTVSPGGNAAGVSPAEKSKFTTSYTYDELGNPLTVADQNGTTSYSYDALNRPVSVVDPRGKTKSVEYDATGGPAKITYPDGSTDEFTYDLDTELRASWTDPQGLTTTYSYDDGAVTTTSPDGSSSTLETEVDYNSTVETVLTDVAHPNGTVLRSQGTTTTSTYPNGSNKSYNRATYNAAGQLIKDDNVDTLITYAYDGFGQLISQSGQDRNLSYEYDLAGNVTKSTYSDGTSVSHETDLAGRIVKTTSWDGTEYDFDYSPENQLASMTSDTGLSYNTIFDGARLASKVWTDSSGAALKSFSYQYEASGLMSADSIDSLDRQYAWNDNGALASVDQDLVTWDARLLTSTGVRDLSYDTTTSRLTETSDSASATEYTYDAQGNRTKSVTGGAENSYTWNALNQLTKLDATTYSYGGNGLRTKVGAAAQVYDQSLKLLSDGQMKYLWSPDGALLAQAPLNSTNSTDIQQAVADGLGSVYAVLDDQLTSVGEYSYSVFGERALTAGTDVSPMGFTSEQHDASGLIYLRFRYLDPTVGQFISVDPLISSTLDAYGYASGNPLQVTDPMGLMSLFGWSDETWSTIGTTLGIVATVATIATLTVATGGTALIVVGAVATTTSFASTTINAVQTAETCAADPGSAACNWAAGGTALGLLPLTKPMKALGREMARSTPRHLSTIDSIAWEARRTNKLFAFHGVNESGYLYDGINPC